MDPARLPADWPFRADCRRISLTPHRWWVVDLGPKTAPPLLLLHGTGAFCNACHRPNPACC
jgi:magnesium chelatase accessory protein